MLIGYFGCLLEFKLLPSAYLHIYLFFLHKGMFCILVSKFCMYDGYFTGLHMY